MESKVLAVGLNCIDIVSYVKSYPIEDSDQRCTRQAWVRGGNASNNATCLAFLLKAPEVRFLGTLADDSTTAGFLKRDMEKYGIKFEGCPMVQECGTPTSVVLCSDSTGSRTIVHSNGGLRELQVEEFDAVFQSATKKGSINWIHFEGRNEAQLPEMISKIEHFNELYRTSNELKDEPIYFTKKIRISIEIEKPRRALAELIPLAHVLFIGKEHAQSVHGAKDKVDAVMKICTLARPGTVVICAWGEAGAAYAMAANKFTGNIMHRTEVTDVEAVKLEPGDIADSLGAGDTFVASVIYCLSSGKDLKTSVEFACHVAGEKLKFVGLTGSDLQNNVSEIKKKFNI